MPSDKDKMNAVYVLCRRCKGEKTYHLPLGDVPCDKCLVDGKPTGLILMGYVEKDT